MSDTEIRTLEKQMRDILGHPAMQQGADLHPDRAGLLINYKLAGQRLAALELAKKEVREVHILGATLVHGEVALMQGFSDASTSKANANLAIYEGRSAIMAVVREAVALEAPGLLG